MGVPPIRTGGSNSNSNYADVIQSRDMLEMACMETILGLGITESMIVSANTMIMPEQMELRQMLKEIRAKVVVMRKSLMCMPTYIS